MDFFNSGTFQRTIDKVATASIKRQKAEVSDYY